MDKKVNLTILLKVILVFFINIQIAFSQEKGTGCTDCFNNFMLIQGLYSSRLGLECNSFGLYSFSGGENSEVSSLGEASFAFGYTSKANAKFSFALGYGSEANGEKSFAIGHKAKTLNASAMAFGTWVNGLAPASITFGKGYSEQKPFINYKESSFAVGFKSDIATFFVSPSPGPSFGTTGRVGIGTMEPAAKLHIRSDDGEEASIYIQPTTWTNKTNAVLSLGNLEHQIVIDGSIGMTFKTPSDRNFSFMKGKVGIGISQPLALLHLFASKGIDSEIFLQSEIWDESSKAVIKIGTIDHQISADATNGMIFKVPSESNFSFLDGNVGIGTIEPKARLDVEGNLRVSSFANEAGQHKMVFADQEGILFTDNTPQYDNLGNHIAEQDIITNGNWLKYGSDDEEQGLYISNQNKIGIGTAMPRVMLDVVSSGNTEIIAFSTGQNMAGFWAANSVYAYKFGVDNDGVGHISANFNNPVNIINFYSNGKIGIGNAVPPNVTSHRLFVEGGITSEEVVINNLTNSREWPDYVFNSNYKLMPLNELKQFIQENGHLPAIPSASEVGENGQNLGEMNILLLQKIEELSLHLIKQQEEIENLKLLIKD